MSFINDLIDSFQAKFPPNRLVVVLTPFFVAGSAWVSGYVAQHFPGLPTVSSGEVTALMIAGAGAALAAAYKWLDGWQKHESEVARNPLATEYAAHNRATK